MKPAHPPKHLVLLILILVTAAFLGGTLRLIPRAHAADISAGLQRQGSLRANLHLDPETELNAGTALQLTATPTPSSTPTPFSASADTGGIIALAIVIVVTVVLGSFMGVRVSSSGKNASKN